VAANVDLEVEVAADGAGVPGPADGADPLPSPNAVTTLNGRRPDQVGVEVAAALALAVNQQVIAVEDGVITGAQDAAGGRGEEGRAACGDDVKALVSAAAAARNAELADVAASPVRAGDGEDVGVELGGAIAGGADDRWRGENSERERNEEKPELQWCSMTRSTMLYSFASAALMK
jgi:hypothetical protein